MRSLVALLLLPTALVCAFVATWFALEYQVPIELASIAGALIGGLFSLVGERLLPQTPDWRGTREDIQVDIISLIVSSAILPPMQLTIDSALRAIYVPVNVFPVHAPLVVQMMLVLLLMELVQYSMHRAMHVNLFLWRFHAMHHSPERMQFWCAFRNHPVDTFLTVALPVAPLAWLGAPPEVVALSVSIVAANATLQHANIAMNDSLLSWVLSTATLHRAHHRREVRLAMCNYGGFLILWDLIFRTRHTDEHKVPALGIEGKDWLPKRYWGQLWAPFSAKWRD